MSLRLPDGSLIPSPTLFFPDDSTDDYGGAGLFSCAEHYIKVLTDLLQDDSKLLSPATKEELFKQQLSAESKMALFYASQLLPPGDVKLSEAFGKFQEAIYQDKL
ncbi:hypothetical protein GX50_00577 [[Emmonsia] crescens]|uniref:Uncharacterized protein n=1 Tax=[Emmonsia] crescens TaxID=73230 RepID=A0A2B7ZT22_9EURO|nr:hypothetical protein GX50_00577 [Emmonsia crescens]